MKKNLFLLASLFFVSFLFSSFQLNDVEKVNDEESDRIALSRIGGTTRSADAVLVEAFANKYTLTVSVEDYTGSAMVEIMGGRTSRQYVFDVYEVGAEIFDISYLRSGTYTVRITLDSGMYEGTFEKSRVGR